MTYAVGFAAVTNPLVPGCETPVYVAWSASNRSAMIRIPACNPYLAFAMMLNFGLDGIKNNLQAPPPVNHDIFEMTAQEKAAAGIDSLPGSLKEAIEALKVNPLARPSLGDHIFECYIENKEKEWDDYRIAITDWELKRYLSNY